MKRFLIHIIIFSLLFFIIEKSAWLLLDSAPSREYDKRLGKVLEGNINKDLIILGSSRGASNILAGQLEQETTLKSYNLSYIGSNILFHQFVLQQLLLNNKAPKQLLYVIDSPYHFKDEVSLRFRYDILYPLSKYNAINNRLVESNKTSWLAKFFYLGRLQKDHFLFKDKTSENRITKPIDKFGSMPFLENKKIVDWNREINLKDIIETSDNPLKIKAFKEIQKICKQNNIDLTFIFTPDFRPFNDDFFEYFKTITPSNIPIFKYGEHLKAYKDKLNFYDLSHLNEKGAKIFTSEISTFLNKKK